MNLDLTYSISPTWYGTDEEFPDMTTIDDQFLRDARLSFEARGVGVLLASIPDLPEKFTARDILEGRDCGGEPEEIAGGLEELAKFGWITKEG